MTLLDRARAVIAGARQYRFPGERESHADQLRETQISLSLMANADAENPDQVRMASEIEDGAENRLTVLLGKPRLTLEEKRERDAIQAAIQARRQSFDGAPVLVERTTLKTRVQGFLPAVAAAPWLGVLLSPWTWLVVTLGLLGLQTGRIGNLKDDVRDLRADLAMSERHLADSTELVRDLTGQVNSANAAASQTAETIEAERARRLRAEREARRIRDAIAQARNGGDVDYGFGGVRNDGPPAPGAPSGDASGGGSR